VIFDLQDCDDCIAHRNDADDVEGEGNACDDPDRSAVQNTVEHALCWGFDLHRDSLLNTVRLNRFIDMGGAGICFGGGSSPYAYGKSSIMLNIVWRT
jgi:hypothetical protein